MLLGVMLAVLVPLLLIAFLLRRFWPRYVQVQAFQRGVLLHKGQIQRVLPPGGYWVPLWKAITVVDTRLQVITVPGQELLTEDGLSIKMSVSGEYAVADAERYLLATAQPLNSLHLYVQTAVRDRMAGLSFDSLMRTRGSLGAELLTLVAPQADRIGLRLESLQVRDVMLSGELKRALGAQVTAQKEGLAALERARGETAALRNLANAARLMEKHRPWCSCAPCRRWRAREAIPWCWVFRAHWAKNPRRASSARRGLRS